MAITRCARFAHGRRYRLVTLFDSGGIDADLWDGVASGSSTRSAIERLAGWRTGFLQFGQSRFVDRTQGLAQLHAGER